MKIIINTSTLYVGGGVQVAVSFLNELNTFNEGEKVKELDSVQRTLLLIQAGAMYTYNECLKGRIASI